MENLWHDFDLPSWERSHIPYKVTFESMIFRTSRLVGYDRSLEGYPLVNSSINSRFWSPGSRFKRNKRPRIPKSITQPRSQWQWLWSQFKRRPSSSWSGPSWDKPKDPGRPIFRTQMNLAKWTNISPTTRFPWNSRDFPFSATFWGHEVVWGRYNLTRWMENDKSLRCLWLRVDCFFCVVNLGMSYFLRKEFWE